MQTQDLRPSHFKLRSQLETIAAAEDELALLVSKANPNASAPWLAAPRVQRDDDANSDWRSRMTAGRRTSRTMEDVLEPEGIVAILQAADSYLELNPRHEKIRAMREQITQQILKNPQAYAGCDSLPDFWSTCAPEVTAELPPDVLAKLAVKFPELFEAQDERQGGTTVTTDPIQGWFYSHAGQQIGPVSMLVIRHASLTGTLNPDDLVWTNEMTEWVRADRALPGLFS